MQWNAPLLLMALKIAPAIVAGNAVVVKSSELAPLGIWFLYFSKATILAIE